MLFFCSSSHSVLSGPLAEIIDLYNCSFKLKNKPTKWILYEALYVELHKSTLNTHYLITVFVKRSEDPIFFFKYRNFTTYYSK